MQKKFRELVLDLVREDLAAELDPGPRRDGAIAFVVGAFFELLIWSLEAKSALAPEEVDRLFHELAAPVVAAARRSEATGAPGSRR